MAEGGQVKSIEQGKPFAAELDAMRTLQATLAKLDVHARTRVLTWLQSAAFEDVGERGGFGDIVPRGPFVR